MSGVCGWFGAAGPGWSAEHMAAPVCRFDRTPLRSAVHGLGAVALSGSIDSASLVCRDALLVAVWGSQAALLADLWESHGAYACAALAGQFACVILDERRGEALLAVDRFATRPLYYQQAGATLLFASSQDAMLRHPLAARRADPQALFDYLTLQASADSAYLGQQRLGPGEFVHLRAGRLTRRSYWRLHFDDAAVMPAPRAAIGAALCRAIDAAPGHQQPGVMLSGGAASAALAARLQALRGTPVATFSVAYATPHGDPLAAARHAARLVSSQHHEQLLGPNDVVDAVARLALASDQPCADAAAVTAYHTALLARSEGTLCLMGGHGMAELFGAGALHARHARLAAYTRVPSLLRQLLAEPLLACLGRNALAEEALRDAPARIAHDAAARQRIAAATLRAQVDPDAPHARLRSWWWDAPSASAGNRTIALDLRQGLCARRLPAVSAGCTLAGVDLLFPLLDPALVDCAARLKPRLKHGGRRSVYQAALRALLPGALAAPGGGDTLPLLSWLRTHAPLRALVFDSIADLRRRHVIDNGAIGALLSVDLNAPPPGCADLLWQLMMLEQWFVHRAPLLPAALPWQAAPVPRRLAPVGV